MGLIIAFYNGLRSRSLDNKTAFTHISFLNMAMASNYENDTKVTTRRTTYPTYPSAQLYPSYSCDWCLKSLQNQIDPN